MAGDGSVLEQLDDAYAQRGALLSIGLEPRDGMVPACFGGGISAHEAYLLALVEASKEYAAAYKPNLAFFESLGSEGVALLERLVKGVPAGVPVIADAKRGDISTTAQHYAKATFETLGARSVTVNPLMGVDAVKPFAEYEGTLTYLLTLTSNPSAAEFLFDGVGEVEHSLAGTIAKQVAAWNERWPGRVGCVVGATRPETMRELRQLTGDVPWLVPGVGAQGGDLAAVLSEGAAGGEKPRLLIHSTRGVLPKADEVRSVDEFKDVVRVKVQQLHEQCAQVMSEMKKGVSANG